MMKPALLAALFLGVALVVVHADERHEDEVVEKQLVEFRKAVATKVAHTIRTAWKDFSNGLTLHEISRERLHAWLERHEKELPEYERFVVACNVGGFGFPSRMGPNSLKGQQLGVYVGIQRSIRGADGQKRALILDPELRELRVTVPPPADKADDEHNFQDILWRIVTDYKLSFAINEAGTFVLSKEP